jgi:hypothetical protein
LARWRATEEFRMSDPNRLTARDDTTSRMELGAQLHAI